MFKVTGTLSYFQLVHTREFFSWGGGGGRGQTFLFAFAFPFRIKPNE